MKKFFSLLSLLICFGIGQIWGAADVTYDFTGSGWTVSNGTLSNGTVSFTGAGSDNFKMSSGYFMLGKSGAYINFPTYSKAVEKIVVTGRSGASASTEMNIYVGQTAVSTETTGSTGTNTYNIASASQAAGTTYTLKVTSSHNAQITKIEIFYAAEVPAGTCATPTFSLDEGTYEGTQSVTISCSTTGATIYYTTDGTTPSTSSSVYSEAIEVAADMTIKAYAVKAGSTDSEVATATYTITEGPDVTLNLIDGNWSFPTKDATTLKEYTNSETGYAVSCYATTAYKSSGSYFIIGKSGSYILLPEFANPVEKIVVVGNPGGSAAVVFNIYDGNDAASTAVTGCTSDQTFVITNPAANKQYTLRITSAHNLQLKAIKIYYGAAPAVASPTISGETSFVTSTEVSLSCSTNGATIYYTTNGNDPKTSGAAYSTPFTLTDGATVKAAAKVGNDWSAVAEKTFTKVTPLTTMAAVQAEAAADEKAINVTISNWVVTAVNNSQVWITDANNEKGIILYKSGHGFEAGNKINGTVIGTKIKLYNDYPELTTLAASDVTVTTADAVTPRVTTIADLTSGFPAEQGTIVKLEDVTYNGSAFSDGVNTITIDTRFVTPTLVNDATYNLTGVVFYGSNHVIKIIPRTADDVVAQSAVVIPTAANLAALKAAARGTYILTLTNAVVTYADDKNAFIEDATAGALIYYQNGGHGFSAGDCLNGDYQVTATDYQGKFEITAIEAQTGAEKTTADVPLTTVTIATLNANFASYESRRVKIAGADVTDGISGSDRNGTINDGAELAVYASVANTITLTAENNVDIIGYPGFHNTNQQLTVWAQADITVNEPETPVVLTDYYEKVTTTEGITEGTYLIVYEGESVAFDGGLETLDAASNTIAVEITNDKKIGVTEQTAAATFYIDPAAGTIKSASNKYIGVSSNSNGLKTSDDASTYSHTFSIDDDGNAVIAAAFDGSTMSLRYNTASNQARFRYYRDNGQQAIQLYKLHGEVIKPAAGLAWDPADDIVLTVGDAFTAPTLNNPNGIAAGEITIASDNTDLATVSNGVVSLVNAATGTATITATFEGNDDYKSATVSYTITVNAVGAVKNVVILAKYDGKWYALMNEVGSANNTLNALDVVYSESNGAILNLSAEEQAKIIWKRSISSNKATFKNGTNYITGASGNTNLTLAANECEWTIDGEHYVIGNRTILYNKAGYFKNYAVSNVGGSDYSDYIVVLEDPAFLTQTEIRDELIEGQWGTFCSAQEVKCPSGASFFTIAYANKQQNGVLTKVYFDEIGEDENLQAGKPYIYIANDNAIKGVLSGDAVAQGLNDNGFVGVLSDFDFQVNSDATRNKYYVIYGNQIRLCADGYFKLLAGRAYIDAKDAHLPTREVAAPAPGRRRIGLENPAAPQVLTDIEATQTTGKAVKMMIGEQLFILRDGKLYDTTGRFITNMQ